MNKLRLAMQRRTQEQQQQPAAPQTSLDEVTRQMLRNGETPEWWHDGFLDNYRHPESLGNTIFRHFSTRR